MSSDENAGRWSGTAFASLRLARPERVRNGAAPRWVPASKRQPVAGQKRL